LISTVGAGVVMMDLGAEKQLAARRWITAGAMVGTMSTLRLTP